VQTGNRSYQVILAPLSGLSLTFTVRALRPRASARASNSANGYLRWNPGTWWT
jgi:hypothetical protein